MQREFAEGCDDIDSHQVVERITELSTELDNMNLHDMPELRDCRRKLLHKMDDFCTKFHDKTKNDWSERDNFTPVAGKCALISLRDETARNF